MKSVLPLFIFIDACGWEIIRADPFAEAFAPYRKRLASVFGYSSACVPSILSGRWPDEHRNWCYFVYDPKNSPFKSLRPLRWLPSALTSRRKVRRLLSRLVKVHLKFRGYFDLYNIPFKYISLFDFTEKKSPLKPGGMNRGENIFDFLQHRDIAYHVSDPCETEAGNLDALKTALAAEQADFAFVYWPELDGMLHRVGNQSPEIGPKLRQYERWLADLLEVARSHYQEIRLYIFSDHGMANCDTLVDVKSRIRALPVKMERDYVAVYDSTMARFWFFNDSARRLITDCLQGITAGRVLLDEELRELRVYFPDRYFGELIFLLDEGGLIVPSHMGARAIRGMHGYHPNNPHSYAALLTNQPEIPDGIVAIPDIFKLMTRDAELAKERNESERGCAAATLAGPEASRTAHRLTAT